jgi:hypothetical protein
MFFLITKWFIVFGGKINKKTAKKRTRKLKNSMKAVPVAVFWSFQQDVGDYYT